MFYVNVFFVIHSFVFYLLLFIYLFIFYFNIVSLPLTYYYVLLLLLSCKLSLISNCSRSLAMTNNNIIYNVLITSKHTSYTLDLNSSRFCVYVLLLSFTTFFYFIITISRILCDIIIANILHNLQSSRIHVQN